MDTSPPISAQTIGRIALIQSVVFNLPDTRSIFRFICRGLQIVPGSGTISYRLQDAEAQSETDSTALNPALVRRFPLRLKERDYGQLLVEVIDAHLFEPYHPYIENLAFMLAVIFEERRQRHLNKIHEEDLENRVLERTRQLEHEVQERARAQAALKISEERLRLALEATQDGIWDLNLQSGHLFWSGRCFTMLGYAPGEFPMSLQRWRVILHPEDQELVWPRLQDLLQGQVDPFEIEYRCHAKDKTFRLIMCRGKPMQWAADGRVVRVVGTHVDITDRRRMEIQLQQSQKMEAIGTLAGGVAHDFNNILGIIIGNAELALHDMPERHSAATHMEEIKKAAMRAKDVVRQLLSFGRRTDQKKEPLKLQRIVDESLQFLRASIPSTIDIRSHAPSDLNVVAADPTQLHQVLINLCTNAAHAMENNGGVLKVRLANVDLGQNSVENGYELAPGRYVQLSVSDTGSGIDPKILDRVFDPFFTTKPDGKGTGIGLAVVHGIVKNHDGDISIESEPGRGTTVKVLLPVVEATPASVARHQKHLPTGNERILLIDDEKSLVKIGMLLLGRLGYTVIARTDPLEALTIFKTAPDQFDLVITDMTMPGMTGAQLSAAILQIRPDIPIILCSGFNEKLDSRSALDFGFRRCIEKPFNQQELATAVRKTLDGL